MSLRVIVALCVLVLLGAIASSASAQDGPSFDCARASTWGEELVCSDPELARLDRRLQARFKAAVAVAEIGRPEDLANLRAEQRGWVKGRDDCWKGQVPRDCVEANYRHREAELIAAWSLENPSWVAAYACAPRTEEVRVSFFETEMPSVRIDRGAESDVAFGDPAIESTRYTSYLASDLVVDGDDAWLRWLGGAEEACTFRAALAPAYVDRHLLR
jgi:uncharacterized protein